MGTINTCEKCGFRWLLGQSGEHDCVEYLQDSDACDSIDMATETATEMIESLQAENERLQQRCAELEILKVKHKRLSLAFTKAIDGMKNNDSAVAGEGD